ncbi:CidA/LrgA family protein [Niallia endozanthoxylica]|uniref:CidA/LrgA family protein n=1 Tax=Niallia endozanthoxylica TaxID=2036016 RepID=A0A5J5HZN0_9BACI|nr:CidA/LrgA family protein [Niallia endozanthoxylica]KAA9028582.1 CidA/LrgA family protein [Niallia endozanthoxylica]
MKRGWILQVLLLIGFLSLGNLVVTLLPIPLPGSTVGMLLLFLFLMTGIIKLEWVEKITSFQLKHLQLLFIPPIVSLIISFHFLEILKWNIFIILFVSSLSCLLGTAYTVEWYEMRKKRECK